MPIAWNEDPPGSERQILENATALLTDIAAEASHRLSPTVAMARDWHRRLYRGTPAELVPTALAGFEANAQLAKRQRADRAPPVRR